MKVSDLRDLLADLDGDLLVVLSKDAEGNGFSPLDSHGFERYLAETGWSGILLDDEEGETDEVDGDGNPWEDEDGNAVTAVSCLVLWPTN